MLKAGCMAFLAVATARLAVDQARPDQLKNRPSLIDYNPVADPKAVVISSDKLARFTVLTPFLLRMEYAKSAGVFEDYSTIAILNRKLPPPAFTHSESGGKLTIDTGSVVLTYQVGSPFSASSLSVMPKTSGAFQGWKFGDADQGNLLGTIRGLDGQDQTPLNCTLNKHILDNGEFNHCEWGLISRDGWVIYDDSKNYILDSGDWWVPTDAPPPVRKCVAGQDKTDVTGPSRSQFFPDGTSASSADECCSICLNKAPDCMAWVWATDGSNACWPLAGWGDTIDVGNRMFGVVGEPTPKTMQNRDAMDLYGFFHGHDYFTALSDFVSVSGKTIMVPRYVSGVWWSRWYNLNNLDLVKVTEDYGSRAIPLDVFVIDMDWHTKNDWSGFTFDPHLFPFPADSMQYLWQMGLPVTLNIHDASGVNSWEAMFPALVDYLGLPKNSTVVPFNILNATVAYAVEDIVLGDLLKKNVSFWWIDWQQGGDKGGMVGDKQNPTMWLNHLRCTDRHRVGDEMRALVLARWGGMGGHRYQVGFSGDVESLTWQNLAYQPYFSATAANVGHGFWSHDIEGPADNMEMYTRWLQVGAFSGTMRSHDRGMSGGGCANDDKFSCSVVEPWTTPNVNFPNVYMEANRQALQFRAHLLPYVYNGHRMAFDSGVGLVRPMYYHYPELDTAYAMDAKGNGVQYMFGPDMLFSPVVAPGTTPLGFAPLGRKTTWLPPGSWVDANTGVITVVDPSDKAHMVTSDYAINQVPLWYQAGTVIPYVPLRSLPTSVGNAMKQYTFLGFKIIPGGKAGATRVYEDDGITTRYLTADAYMYTEVDYTLNGNVLAITIQSTGNKYPEFPATRAYQLRLLNFPPIAAVNVNGATVVPNRYGKIAATGTVPPTHQYYYDFSALPEGMGPVIDLVNMRTDQTITVNVKLATSVSVDDLKGVYGAVSNALLAKANLDIERTTPGSNKEEPAYTNVLSSVGQALEFTALSSLDAFASAVKSVPELLTNAIGEIQALKSGRKDYSIALLQAATN